MPIAVGFSRQPAHEAAGHRPPGALSLPSAPAREVGPYHVELFLLPRGLVAGRDPELAFRLSRDGHPVTGLRPYIGALGHYVIISEDTQSFLHGHLEQFAAILPSGGGPEVCFHTKFPHPGRCKIWGQFKQDDELVVADFVVSVEEPILPGWLGYALVRS